MLHLHNLAQLLTPVIMKFSHVQTVSKNNTHNSNLCLLYKRFYTTRLNGPDVQPAPSFLPVQREESISTLICGEPLQVLPGSAGSSRFPLLPAQGPHNTHTFISL